MLWFSPKLPVDNEERLWVDEGFARLEKMLGRSRLLDARVILPNPEYFPDAYDGSEAAAEILFRRACDYMHVDRRRLKLEIFPDENRGTPRDFPIAYRNRPTRCRCVYSRWCDAGRRRSGSDRA